MEEQQTLLIESNFRLLYYVANQFKNTRVDVDDLAQIGSLGLIQAAEKFDPEDGTPFSSFAITAIRNEILKNLQYNNRQKRKGDVCSLEGFNLDDADNSLTWNDMFPSEDHSPDTYWSSQEDLEERRIVFTTLFDSQKPEHREMIRLYHFEELTSPTIAKQLGFKSAGSVNFVLNRFTKQLREQLDVVRTQNVFSVYGKKQVDRAKQIYTQLANKRFGEIRWYFC